MNKGKKKWRYLFIAFLVVVIVTIITILWIFLSDRIEPSQGEVWPKVRYAVRSSVLYQVRDRIPFIAITGKKCERIIKVIDRIKKDLKLIIGNNIPNSGKYEVYKKFDHLNVNLVGDCEEYPYLGMNETYELSISTNSELRSTSIWGIIRGLETFVQLFYHENKNIYISGVSITDYPNYEHRGLLLDTGRLYAPVQTIMTIINGMAMNKMNVFHWHICDNLFCPIKSEVFPNMSSILRDVYTKDDVNYLVNYATERGIRIIPEFDVPGHQASLKKVFPHIFLHCDNSNSYELMNPTSSETYKFLRGLLGELKTWFPDEYFHLGGDEAYPECWAEHTETVEYMNEHNMSLVDLQTMFHQKVASNLKADGKQIVWQDVFDYGINISTKDTVVQVWNNNFKNEMAKVLDGGFSILYSSFWYLNYQPYKYDFSNYYTQDPRTAVKWLTQDLKDNIIGGEACMWTDDLRDYTLLLDWIYPRTCATAEVLWSSTDGSEMTRDDWSRIMEQTLRMTKRGVPTKMPRS